MCEWLSVLYVIRNAVGKKTSTNTYTKIIYFRFKKLKFFKDIFYSYRYEKPTAICYHIIKK